MDNAELQKMFDTTARAFVVQVNGKWGFDWAIPRGRVDAISTEITAQAVRTAHDIGYDAPKRFFADQLSKIAKDNNGILPEVITPVGYCTDDKGFISGQNNYSAIQD